MKTNQNFSIRKLVAVAVFCALAFVLTLVFHFRVQFLSFDLKDAVMTIGAMYFGPLAGLAMVVIVSLLEFVSISTTGVYGLIMNIVASAAFVMIGSLIYKYKRTLAGAVIGMSASVVGMTAVMMVANLVITPFYMGVSVDAVAGMIPTLLLPFNLVKALFNAAVVFILYKPVSSVLRAGHFVTDGKGASADKKFSARNSIIISVIAIAVAVACFVVFRFVLGGSFSVA